MNKANRYHIKPLTYIAAAVVMASLLIMGLLSSMVNAASVTSVGSNIQQVINDGENLTLSVRMQKSSTPVTELEVDHNLGALGLPEFSVYADPANPYGDAAAKAQFDNAGVVITYTETSTEGLWVIDFGATVTGIIRDAIEQNDIPAARFYLVLRNDANVVWGSMSPTTPDNTFTLNIATGDTSDNVAEELVTALPPEEQVPAAPVTPAEDAPTTAPAAQQVVVPGVPNTAIGL